MRVLKIISVFLICVMAVSCQGLGREETGGRISFPSDSVVDGGPVGGGTLNIFSLVPDDTDPLLTKKPSLINVYKLVFDGLVKTDAKGNPGPSLAESWYVSADGLKWVFNLKDDVKWHDKTYLTPQDVIFTVERIKSFNDKSPYMVNISNINSISETGDHGVTLFLNEPSFNTPALMNFPIVQKKYYGERNMETRDFVRVFPPGTGPYMIKDYEKGVSFSLARAGDTPLIPSITVHLYTNMRQVYDAFQKRELDIINCPFYVDVSTGKKDLLTVDYVIDSWELLAINNGSGPFVLPEARHLLYGAVDVKAIIEQVYGGYGLESFFPTSHSPRESKDPEDFSHLSFPGQIQILVNEENSHRTEACRMICDMLLEWGINARPEILPFDGVIDRVSKGEYTLALLGMALTPYGDLSLLSSGYGLILAQDQFTESFLKLKRSISQGTYDYHRKETEDLILEEMPYVGLYRIKEKVVYNNRIKGNIDPCFLNIYNNIENWYLLNQGDN